jgi:hypothetical protein
MLYVLLDCHQHDCNQESQRRARMKSIEKRTVLLQMIGNRRLSEPAWGEKDLLLPVYRGESDFKPNLVRIDTANQR